MVKAELVSVGQSGEQSLKRIEIAGGRASGGLKGLGRQAELLRTGIRTLAREVVGRAERQDRERDAHVHHSGRAGAERAVAAAEDHDVGPAGVPTDEAGKVLTVTALGAPDGEVGGLQLGCQLVG